MTAWFLIESRRADVSESTESALVSPPFPEPNVWYHPTSIVERGGIDPDVERGRGGPTRQTQPNEAPSVDPFEPLLTLLHSCASV